MKKDIKVKLGVGMRTMKTAVAVMVCIIISMLVRGFFEISYMRQIPIYACVAAVVCMQDTMTNTISYGVARSIGTIMGGAVGVLLLLVKEFLGDFLLVPAIGFGIVFCISICNISGQRACCVICCVAFLSVIINDSGGSQYAFALHRITETLVGVIVALFINKFISLPRSFKKSQSEAVSGCDSGRADSEFD